MPRGHVVAAGCWLWATMTALFAMTTRLAVAMPICAVNGIGAWVEGSRVVPCCWFPHVDKP